jgi:hypothetical protein
VFLYAEQQKEGRKKIFSPTTPAMTKKYFDLKNRKKRVFIYLLLQLFHSAVTRNGAIRIDSPLFYDCYMNSWYYSIQMLHKN